jgi:hypothetical protein
MGENGESRSPAKKSGPQDPEKIQDKSSTSLRLSEARRADLHESGIRDEIIDGPLEIADSPDGKGWTMLWTDLLLWEDGPLAGKMGKHIVIPDRDKRRIGRDGDEIKVEWPSGLTTFLGCVRLAKGTKRPEDAKRHVVVEAPRQALAVASYAPDDVCVWVMNGCRGIHAKIKERLAKSFAGAELVTLVPDADWHTNPDVRHAMTIQAPGILTEAGVPEIKVGDVPGLGKDGADDVIGRTIEEHRAALVAQILDTATPVGGSKSSGRRLRVRKASEIKPRATRWLWTERDEDGTAEWIPLGGLTLLGGREGVGKSTIAYQTVAKITRGKLPGAFYGRPMSVVISATEDAWEQTIIPRLMANGADLDRVFQVDAVTPEGAPEGVKLPDDLAALEALIKVEDVVLVLLDPLIGSISGTLDSHKDHDVRIALEPVSRLAHEGQVSILGLIHENKAGGSDLLNRIMASRAFTAVARGVLYAARDQGDGDNVPRSGDVVEKAPLATEPFLFGQTKSNWGRMVPWTLRYHIEVRHVGHDDELDEPITGTAVVWDGKVIEGVQDIVTRQEAEARNADRDTAQNRAADWLFALLEKHYPDGVESSSIKEAAEANGHSLRTLQRAKNELGVVVTSRGRETAWSLPGTHDTHGMDGIRGTDGTDPETRATRANVPDTGGVAQVDGTSGFHIVTCADCGTYHPDVNKTEAHFGGSSCPGYRRRKEARR